MSFITINKKIGKWWGPKEIQPILSVHGWQDNAGTFDKLIPIIINNNTSLFCIDLPGHGFSSHNPEGTFYYVFWDGVILLRRIVKHFKWDKVSSSTNLKKKIIK